jgi:hypothetical protein
MYSFPYRLVQRVEGEPREWRGERPSWHAAARGLLGLCAIAWIFLIGLGYWLWQVWQAWS